MKKGLLFLLCTFIFIMPFFVCEDWVYADETVEYKLNKVMEYIATKSEIQRHDWLGGEDNETIYDSSYALKLPEPTSDVQYTYDIEGENAKGTITIDGVHYYLNISYNLTATDGNENTIQATRNVSKPDIITNSEKTGYVQYLDLSQVAKSVDGITSNIAKNGLQISLVSANDSNIKHVYSEPAKISCNIDSASAIPVSKEDFPTAFEAIWNALPFANALGWGDWAVTVQFLVETLSSIIAPFGDSFLHMISLAVGEVVTIDTIVFDDVNKTDINFFDANALKSGTKSEPLKSLLSNTVNTWYGFFRSLALIFYCGLLVYMGLKILLNSTAEKKAVYKTTLTAWTMGIAMLFLFPYIMKYTIMLNHVVCRYFSEAMSNRYVGESGGTSIDGASQELIDTEIRTASRIYGEDEFVMLVLGSEKSVETFRSTAIVDDDFGSNAMMRIRFLGTAKRDLPLVIIYCIMIGQLIALLIMYYRRVFMIAFLITIFPLVCVVYPLSKIGDLKMNSFGIWFKEFLVNVFVQSFHAATYVTVVSIGVNSYLENDNWLFMLVCILFLFEGEKIIRGLFNAKSATGSIGDLAAAGALAMNFAKSAPKLMPKFGGKDKAAKEKDPDEKAKEDRGDSGDESVESGLSGAPLGAGGTSGGMSTATAVGPTMTGRGAGSDIELGREIKDNSKFNKVTKAVDDKGEHKSKITEFLGNGADSLLQNTGSLIGGTAGTILGGTFGLAQRDGKHGLEAGINGAIGGLESGKDYGRAIGSLPGKGVSAINKRIIGAKVASDIMNGDMDSKLDIDAAVAGLDAEAAEAKREAYRKVYAKVARKYAKGAKDKAEIIYIKETLDRRID